MKITKISLSLGEKISLETYLGNGYKFSMLEPKFYLEVELGESEDVREIAKKLRSFLATELSEYKNELLAQVEKHKREAI